MQGVNCVKGEIHNVLTVLHLSKPSRAAYDRNAFSAAEAPSPLVCGLQDLYSELGSVSDLRLFDTRAYLRPFLRVIHSENTDVVTTGIALQSVHKFLLYGHIHRDSPYVAEAISEIVYDVTNCTWSGNWKEESEVVRMKMLEVVLECLRCDAGDLLSDEAVCGMVKECFSARNRDGASKLLAKYAENILTHMVLVIFARLDPETRAGGTIDPTKALSSSPLKALLPSLRVTSRERNGSRSRNTHRRTTSQATAPALAASREEEAGRGFGQGEPYGIPALQSVFRFLANLIDPSDHSSDHNTKILGLRLIRTVFETAGKRLGFFPPLVEVIQNELCKNLLQSSQTRDIYVLSLVLRIIFDIFTSVKQHLKIQLEVFFSVIHLRVGESTAATFDHKRMVAESLLDFCKEPALIVGLYRNYDCEVGYSSLFEDLCQHLAQSAVPSDPPVPTTLHVLSFESVLAVLESISVRFCVEADPERKDDQEGSDEDEMLLLNPEEETRLAKQRQQKMKLRLAKDRFNAEGKKSLSFLQGLKLLADPLTPESVVTFFETTPGLDKTRIGEVLGASDDFSVKVLGHFCSTFDFQKLAVSNQSGEGQVNNARPTLRNTM
jgi:brefeldin A-resistance guanine nucleotide exchange factor 1